MTTTASSTAHPPAAQAPQTAQGQSPNTARTGQGQQPPADLFSSLLALLSPDATPLNPLGGEAGAASTQTSWLGDDPQAEDGSNTDNPLALLMAWTTPQGLEPAPLSGNGSLIGETRGLDARADRLGGATADGLLAANGSATGSAAGRQVAAPWQPAAARGVANAATPFTPGPAGAQAGMGDVPATRWSRAASPADTGAQAWPVRSTVALDARFQASTPGGTAAAFGAGAASAADADDLALPGASPTGSARAVGEAAASVVSASGTTADAGLGGEASADGGNAHGESGTDQNQAQDPYAAPADAEAVEVQHWGAGAMRHASLRVGEDAQSAIDIQLALRGDELQLDIRTDDAAARDALREQAQSALGERLQQGGLTLGQVSVGEQGQGDPRRDGQAAQRGERAGAPDAPAAPARPATPGANGANGANGQGLDLFI